MNDNKELSTIEIINRGWILVNIPSIVIILLVWFFLVAYLEINGKISVIIGCVLAWVYWEFAITKWIKWALYSNVNPDRLLKIGQFSLLLWNSRQIDKILNEKK